MEKDRRRVNRSANDESPQTEPKSLKKPCLMVRWFPDLNSYISGLTCMARKVKYMKTWKVRNAPASLASPAIK